MAGAGMQPGGMKGLAVRQACHGVTHPCCADILCLGQQQGQQLEIGRDRGASE